MNYTFLLSAMMTLSSMAIQAITPESLLQQKMQAEENTFLANMKPGLQHTIVIPIMRSYIKPINRSCPFPDITDSGGNHLSKQRSLSPVATIKIAIAHCFAEMVYLHRFRTGKVGNSASHL